MIKIVWIIWRAYPIDEVIIRFYLLFVKSRICGVNKKTAKPRRYIVEAWQLFDAERGSDAATKLTADSARDVLQATVYLVQNAA